MLVKTVDIEKENYCEIIRMSLVGRYLDYNHYKELLGIVNFVCVFLTLTTKFQKGCIT